MRETRPTTTTNESTTPVPSAIQAARGLRRAPYERVRTGLLPTGGGRRVVVLGAVGVGVVGRGVAISRGLVALDVLGLLRRSNLDGRGAGVAVVVDPAFAAVVAS